MIIEVDEYKKKVKEYDANRSEDFHLESSKLADRDFIDALKSKKYKRIILMAGGTASGKTEFAKSYLIHKNQLVYDGTLKSYEGFKVKRDKIKNYDKSRSTFKVVLIIPYDWRKAFEAFLGRERKMKPAIFFNTQIQSKRTAARILLETKFKVDVYISRIEEGKERLGYIQIRDSRGKKARILEKLADLMEKIAVDNGFEINNK